MKELFRIPRKSVKNNFELKFLNSPLLSNTNFLQILNALTKKIKLLRYRKYFESSNKKIDIFVSVSVCNLWVNGSPSPRKDLHMNFSSASMKLFKQFEKNLCCHNLLHFLQPWLLMHSPQHSFPACQKPCGTQLPGLQQKELPKTQAVAFFCYLSLFLLPISHLL